MIKKVAILFIVSLFFSSCSNEDEESSIVNFSIFFEPVCAESVSVLCVSIDEFERIREVFEANENESDLDCLPITVTDLKGTVHEGLLRGFSSTDSDIPCDQEVKII